MLISEQLQAVLYNALDVPSITGMLTAAYGVTAIFTPDAMQVDSDDDAYFPYVTFSFPSITQYDDKTSTGVDAIVQVDIWSRQQSTQIKLLADQVYSVLHRASLGLTGEVDCVVTDVEFSDDPDAITRRCMILLRVTAIE